MGVVIFRLGAISVSLRKVSVLCRYPFLVLFVVLKYLGLRVLPVEESPLVESLSL
jgi:hypothetical protein